MAFPDLRLLARTRIDSGQLPPCEHVTLLGSPGNGATCSLCDSPITSGQVEYDVEIAGRRGSCWRFHIGCHAIWRDVCDELWPPEAPAHGQMA
jgi:hypothetical protein